MRERTASSAKINRFLLQSAILCVGVNIFCFCSPSLRAQAPNVSWVRQFGGSTLPGYSSPGNNASDLELNPDGDVLIVGTFLASNPDFPAPNATNTVPNGAYFAEYDSAGNILRTKSGSNDDFFGGASDLAGDIYISGYTNEPGTNGHAVSAVQLTKFDAAGNPIWSVASQSDNQDFGCLVNVDAATNIYISGLFVSTNFTLGSFVLTNDYSGNNFDQFISKFDSTGKVLWAKALYGADNPFYAPAKPQFDPAGNLIMAGTFEKPLSFGSTTLTNSGGDDLFLAKFDTEGNVLWVKDVGVGFFYFHAWDSVDAQGNIYLAGTISSATATIDSVTITNQAGFQVYLAKFDSDGNGLWAKVIDGGSGQANNGMIFVDGAGNVYQTASLYTGSVNLDGTVLSSPTNNLAYVAKYDGAGNLLWAETMYDSNGQISPELVQGDAYGNIYLAGTFSGTGVFGNVQVSTLNENEGFLMKLDGPRLNIQLSGNQAIISWPTNAAGLSLESSSDLTSTQWSPVTDTPGIVGQNYTVTNSIAAGAKFYRLRNF